MDVEVRLFSGLREGRFPKRTIDVPDPACVGDLLRRLGIDAKDVSLSLVNGRFAKLDAPLADRDVVALFPPIGGG
jgi:molybdopterin synthase sulfur carrier subunit